MYSQVMAKKRQKRTEKFTPLKAARIARELKQQDVAKAVGTHPANLLRIESGIQTPKRDVARRLFDFYDGAVSLGAIYDPQFAEDRNVDAP